MSTEFPLYPKRDFSPGCDVRFESPRSSKSNTSLLTKPLHDNDDDEKAHQYEDPTMLSDQVRVLQEGGKRPRKRFNDMYEAHIPLKNLKELRVRRSTDESDLSDLSDTYTRESCLNRCILFFVLLTSVTALILVVLLMLGKVGVADRCACNAEQGNTKAESPNGQKLSGSKPSEVNEPVLSPPDVQSLEDTITNLMRNITSIKKSVETLQRDVQSTKGDLNNINNDITGTKDKLSELKTGTQDSIDKINNISQRLDASVSAVNLSFHMELASVKNALNSKLNNTAEKLLDADSSLQSRLNTINSSLIEQIQIISKLQGPTGPPGVNGSKGIQGDQGSNGTQGSTGLPGEKGIDGSQGDPGRNGTDGVPGEKGDAGAQGDKGDQGPQGSTGTQGAQGPQGPQCAGNFSLCKYKMEPGATHSPGPSATSNALLTEPEGKKIIGATCSTNRAQEYNFSRVKATSGPNIGKYIYSCKCKGDSSLFTDGVNMQCFLHYWECPLTT